MEEQGYDVYKNILYQDKKAQSYLKQMVNRAQVREQEQSILDISL